MDTSATILGDLEVTALAVINTLKIIPKYSDLKIGVFGGMAVMAYVPDGRRTKDVNFVVDNVPGAKLSALPGIREDIEEHCCPKGSFYVDFQLGKLSRTLYHMYTTSKGEEKKVRVDFWESELSPDVRCGTYRISDIPAGRVPYVSREDLVLVKIDLCQREARALKVQLDARDAKSLLAVGQPLCLTEERQKVVRQAIRYCMKEFPETPLSWWEERLGMHDLGSVEPHEAGVDAEGLRVNEGADEEGLGGNEEGADEERDDEDSDAKAGGEQEEQEGWQQGAQVHEQEGQGEGEDVESGYVDDEDEEQGRAEDAEGDEREPRGGQDVPRAHTRHHFSLQFSVSMAVWVEMRGEWVPWVVRQD